MAGRNRSRNRSLAALAAITLAVVLAGSADATVVRRMSLSEMVGRAENVVHARAIENTVSSDPATHYDYTVTTFEVIAGGKGAARPGDLIDVEIPGGHVPGADYETIVASAPRFTVGEEVVLFTSPGDRGHKFLVGFFQGAVRLASTPGGLVVPASPPEFLPVTPGNKPPLMDAPEKVVARDGTTISGGPGAVQAPGKRAKATPAAGTAGAQGERPRAGAVPEQGAQTLGQFLDRVRQIDLSQRGEE
jgi:hypothetical protein